MTPQEQSMRQSDNGTRVSDRLTLAYLLSLSALAVLVIAGQVFVQKLLVEQQADSSTINLAGRQRMLSQKIAMQVMAAEHATSLEELRIASGGLEKDLKAWQTAHAQLSHGAVQDPGSESGNTPPVRQLFDDIRDSYLRLSHAGYQVLERMRHPSSVPPNIAEWVVEAEAGAAEFLVWMDAIVLQYESEARGRVDLASRVELGLMSLALVVLLLEAVLVFRPVVRRVRMGVIDLANARRVAESRAHELTEQFSRLRKHLDEIARGRSPQPLTLTGNVAGLDSIVGGINDLVSELTKASHLETRLRQLAHQDPLTGLPNRKLFDDRLLMAHNRAVRNRSPYALLFIDLDGFKSVNDTYGHEAGDRMLVHVANTLRKTVRTSDTICRFGGDEFVIILEQIISAEDANRVAYQVGAQVAEPIAWEKTELRTGASVGVAVYPEDATDPQALLQRADECMYEDKRRRQQGEGGIPSRMLLVDDEPENLDILERTFGRSFNVRRADDGVKGLRIAREWKPHVVVSDQRMPGLQGVHFLAKLNRESPDIVRVLVTGYSDHEATLRAVNDAHVDGFFEKPIEPENLRRAVEAALRNTSRSASARR